MGVRVHELARELQVSSATVLKKLALLGVHLKSASSIVDGVDVTRLRELLGQPDAGALTGSQAARQSSWHAGAIRPSTHPDTIYNVNQLRQTFSAAGDHQEILAALGSQFVFAKVGRIPGFEECAFGLVRFSGAIESAFGLTREVFFFYSPHRDLQIRTFKAAKQTLAGLDREVTPDMMFFWAPDERLREKLDDWSTGNFLVIPLDLSGEGDPISFITLLRDYVYSRDLFYETTPVQGERFFGRRRLLQSLRDDVQHQRVTGLFGLRKAGKTSVLLELMLTLADAHTLIFLRDLESLPSPPVDPVPDLLADLVADILAELRTRHLRSQELSALGSQFTLSEFKRAFQAILRKLESEGIRVVVMLDEIEYLTSFDEPGVGSSPMTSVAQLLGVLRSLVQENGNFNFVMSGLTSSIIENGRLFGRPNPLFSWAKANFLAPFERHEADDLALSVGHKMGLQIEDGALEAMFEATGGHAYLYRHLASTVVQGLPVDVFSRQIRRSDVLRALKPWRRLVAGNMQEMLNHVKRYYPDESYLLEVLQQEPAEFGTLAEDAPSALGHLISLGLVQEVDNGYDLTPVLHLL